MDEQERIQQNISQALTAYERGQPERAAALAAIAQAEALAVIAAQLAKLNSRIKVPTDRRGYCMVTRSADK